MLQRRLLIIGPEHPLLEALRMSSDLEGIEIETCQTDTGALARLRARAYDAVVTSPTTSIADDVDLLSEMRGVRPGVKVIILAPAATPAHVLGALKAHAFACFTAPFEVDEIASMVCHAVDSDDWKDGIQLWSARPTWISMRVACRRVTAERLISYMSALRTDLQEGPREDLMLAFRETLLNAMEHGAGFDAEKVIDVSAVQTERAIVYYFRDPGAGFDASNLRHAAVANPEGDPVAHVEERERLGIRPGGFGLLLTLRIVDEMMFSESGNEVVLIKHTR